MIVMHMEIQSNNQKVQIGDQLQLYMHNIYQKDTHSKPNYVGTVKNIEQIETNSMKGRLLTAQLEGYGITQPFYEPGSVVLTGQIDERRNNSGMPTKYMSKTGKDFKFDIYGEDTTTQKALCNAYIQNFKSGIRGTGLYIYSETPGSGKTFLTCCIGNEILKRQDISLKFITMIDFIELSFKASKVEDDWDKLKAIKEATLLILDDIGANNTKTSIDNALFSLVDYRNKNNLPTIYTSNLSKEGLKEKFNDRVVSRIFDNTIPLAMPERSIRDEQSKKMVEKRLTEILSNINETDNCFM